MENRKQDIIDSAIELFCERGLDLTSMQDIAKAVGITKSTIYFYYDSKVALIQDVYQYCFHKDVEACNEGVETEPDAVARLCRRFHNIINYSLSHPKEAKIEQLYTCSPIYGEENLHFNDRFYQDIKNIILQGIEDASIKDEPAWLLTTMYYGIASQMYLRILEEPELWNADTIHSCDQLIKELCERK